MGGDRPENMEPLSRVGALSEPMKIGIDARWIFHEKSGISTYTRELLRYLPVVDQTNEYTLFFEHQDLLEETTAYAALEKASNFKTELLGYGIFSIKNQLKLPGKLRKLKIDVFHSPNYMIPFFAFPCRRAGRVKSVVTIHDLIPLLFPEYTPRALKTRFMLLYRLVMREVGVRSDIVITVSDHSRKDVLKEMHISNERAADVITVPNGVASEYKPKEKISGDIKTILYVGRFDPYKNLAGLLETFSRVRTKTKLDVRLKIIGTPDARYPEPELKAKELGLNPWIDWSGYVGGEELVKAYQEADVFMLQSKYEGFGLTVLEAMACGTPVVCSNRSSLPEVAGSAAILEDPDNYDAFASAVVNVLEDQNLAAELAEKGIKQAARFTWKRTAEETLKAYQCAVNK